jgi:hypothetical protein
MPVSMSSGGADALVEGHHGFVDHRHQDAVDDEARHVSGRTVVLPMRWARCVDGGMGGIAGGEAADDLHQLHHRHGVHEVHADEAMGRAVAAAMRVMGMEEVLVARMVCRRGRSCRDPRRCAS